MSQLLLAEITIKVDLQADQQSSLGKCCGAVDTDREHLEVRVYKVDLARMTFEQQDCDLARASHVRDSVHCDTRVTVMTVNNGGKHARVIQIFMFHIFWLESMNISEIASG